MLFKTFAAVATYLFWCNIRPYDKPEATDAMPGMRRTRSIALTVLIMTAAIVTTSFFVPEIDLLLYFVFPVCWLLWAILFISKASLGTGMDIKKQSTESAKVEKKENVGRYVWFTFVFGLLCHTYPCCKLGLFSEFMGQMGIFAIIFFCTGLILLILPDQGDVFDLKILFTKPSPNENLIVRFLLVFAICLASSLSVFLIYFSQAFGLKQTGAYVRSGMELIVIFNLFGTGLLFRQWSRGFGFYKMYISWFFPFLVTLFIMVRFTLPTWKMQTESLFSLTPTIEIFSYLVGFAGCFAILHEGETIWLAFKRAK